MYVSFIFCILQSFFIKHISVKFIFFYDYNESTQADASAPTMMKVFSGGTNMWIDSFKPISQ